MNRPRRTAHPAGDLGTQVQGEDQHQGNDKAGERQHPRRTRRTHPGQAIVEKTPEGQGPPPENHYRHDHQKRYGRGPSRTGVQIADQTLGHADHQPPQQRQREGHKAPHQGGGTQRIDEQHHCGGHQARDRRQEDAGQGGETRPQHPVEGGHPVGGNPGGGGGADILRHRGGLAAEFRGPVEQPQQGGHHQSDHQDPHPVGADGQVSEGQAVVWQEALDKAQARTVAHHHRRFDDGQYRQGHHQAVTH